MTFETNALQALYFQGVETRALSTRVNEADVNMHLRLTTSEVQVGVPRERALPGRLDHVEDLDAARDAFDVVDGLHDVGGGDDGDEVVGPWCRGCAG